MTVYCQDADPDNNVIEESHQTLLLERGASITKMHCVLAATKSRVLVTNFAMEYLGFNKGAAISYLEVIYEAKCVIDVADFERQPDTAFARKRVSTLIRRHYNKRR